METNIKRWFNRLRVCVHDQRGLSLVEAIVAVAILGSAIVTFVSGLSAGTIAVREGDQKAVAQSLARTQLEYIKSCRYDISYSKVDEPEGYTISIDVSSVPDTDTDIQKITVDIFRDGDSILSIEDYKVNR